MEIKIYKLIQVNLCDIGLGNVFLNIIPKYNRKNKLDFIKMKNFCASNAFIREVKQQSLVLEKTFENDIFDKDVYKMYKTTYNLIMKRQRSKFKNRQKIWIDISLKEYIKMTMKIKLKDAQCY